jgi:hypothetical protein
VAETAASSATESQVVTSIVTAVEVHVSSVLDRLLSTSEIVKDKLGAALLAQVGDDMQRSWDSRADWLKNGFGLQVKVDDSYGDFNLVVEVRNAVVHGGGRLTVFQTRGIDKTVALRRDLDNRLDVDAGADLRFGPQSIDKMVEAVRNYVTFFDGHVLSKYPELYR